MVVQQALLLPPTNRIKPICREFPGVEPVRRRYARPCANCIRGALRSHELLAFACMQVQVRKWIRNMEALMMAQPTAKLVPRLRTTTSPTPDSPPPDLADESSETESIASSPGSMPTLPVPTHPVSAVQPLRAHTVPAQQRKHCGGVSSSPHFVELGAIMSPPSLHESCLQHVRLAESAGLAELRAARELLSLGSWSDIGGAALKACQ